MLAWIYVHIANSTVIIHLLSSSSGDLKIKFLTIFILIIYIQNLHLILLMLEVPPT